MVLLKFFSFISHVSREYIVYARIPILKDILCGEKESEVAREKPSPFIWVCKILTTRARAACTSRRRARINLRIRAKNLCTRLSCRLWQLAEKYTLDRKDVRARYYYNVMFQHIRTWHACAYFSPTDMHIHAWWMSSYHICDGHRSRTRELSGDELANSVRTWYMCIRNFCPCKNRWIFKCVGQFHAK